MSDKGSPRLRSPNRTEQLPPWTLDQALADDHPVRTIWAYVASVNLDRFLNRIRAVEGQPGRNATDPRLLLALWMFATTDGIGSARWLAELCQAHIAYRWLCGGVTVNYHTLSDFRTRYQADLDELLTDHVAALLHEGWVALKQVALDGMRVRADAGSGSFRRGQTIDELRDQVSAQLAQMKDQPDDAPGSAAHRCRAAKNRHLEEKAARLEQAKVVAAAAEARRAERLRVNPKEAAEEAKKDPRKTAGRGSTTDPDARHMKMPDGGYRPGYNVQAATSTADGVIIAVDVTNQGTDGGLMGQMIDRIKSSYGRSPDQMLVDGGFASVEDVEAAAGDGIDVYMPLRDEKKDLARGNDPYARKKKDGAGMAGLRARMGTPEAKKIYTNRAATAEWVNAGMRNRGLYQFVVRGLTKVRAVVLMQALVHNLFATIRLCAKKQSVQGWTERLRAGLASVRREGRVAAAG